VYKRATEAEADSDHKTRTVRSGLLRAVYAVARGRKGSRGRTLHRQRYNTGGADGHNRGRDPRSIGGDHSQENPAQGQGADDGHCAGCTDLLRLLARQD